MLVIPQHTMDVGALFNTVAQLVYMPRNSLPNCIPAAASTGLTRELKVGTPKAVTALCAHSPYWSKPQQRAELFTNCPHV